VAAGKEFGNLCIDIGGSTTTLTFTLIDDCGIFEVLLWGEGFALLFLLLFVNSDC
jgi:hypothetical protein